MEGLKITNGKKEDDYGKDKRLPRERLQGNEGSLLWAGRKSTKGRKEDYQRKERRKLTKGRKEDDYGKDERLQGEGRKITKR